jgi:hypothetical protein
MVENSPLDDRRTKCLVDQRRWLRVSTEMLKLRVVGRESGCSDLRPSRQRIAVLGLIHIDQVLDDRIQDRDGNAIERP